MNTAIEYTKAYSEFAGKLSGQNQAWLTTLRANALVSFATQGFPSPRDEEWRYTNVGALEKKVFVPVARPAASAVDTNLLQRYQLLDAWSLVFVDGCYCSELSMLTGLPDTVQVMSVANMLALNHAESSIADYLGQAVAGTEHGFIAFNTAWFSDGWFVYVPKNQVLAKPIQCLSISTQAGVLTATRNVLVLDTGADVQLIETFLGTDVEYLSVSVTEVLMGENANLSLSKLQCESAKAYHFGGTYIKQANNARCQHDNFAMGGLLARSDIRCDLAKAAECELNGLYLGNKRQHHDNHTRINHLESHGISRETYKGVLADRARGVFQGRVLVADDAQKTDSAMSNRNLLLSADAEADTKPQLEIYADDVKCSHGVTVGQLDEKSVFYLQSRGVDEDTARNMLTFAFANEMVDKIKHKDLHDVVLAEVLLRFPQSGIENAWL